MLAGCGGDDQADTVPTPTRPANVTADSSPSTTVDPSTGVTTAETSVVDETTAGTVAATTESPNSTVPPQTTATPVPDGHDPNEIIITLADMPTGWSPTPPEEEDDDSDDDLACLDAAFESVGLGEGVENEKDYPQAEAGFSQSEFGPFILSFVVSGMDGGLLSDFMDVLPEAFASCDGETDPDGTTYSVLPISFPDLGDQTFATRLDGTGAMLPISMVLVLTRVDDVLIYSANAALGGGIDAALLEDLTRVMVDRI
jgi:hypothetical protein